MKKLAKKIFSIILVVTLLLSSSYSANAASIASKENDTTIMNYIEEIEDGKMYIEHCTNKNIVILTNEKEHLIDISIKYSEEPNKVYAWSITTDSLESSASQNVSFWNDVIEYAENHIDIADIVYFENVTYKEPIEINPHSRLSAVADMYEDLANLIGDDEYTDALRYTKYTGSDVYRIKESLTFRYSLTGYQKWSKSISIASLITSILGESVTDARVKTLCTVFNIAVAAAGALVPAGKINKYICKADYSRYVTVNGSKYVYNITDKFIEYTGYENATGAGRASLDTQTKDTYYSHSSSYFSSYIDQYEDAYEMYKKIGQQP